jgi:hypothetical protein
MRHEEKAIVCVPYAPHLTPHASFFPVKFS